MTACEEDIVTLNIKIDDNVDDSAWPEWACGEARGDGVLTGYFDCDEDGNLEFVALANVANHIPMANRGEGVPA